MNLACSLVFASVQNAAAHATNYAVAAADDSASDCRSTNDDRAVPAGAACMIDTARTDDGLGVIGSPCHCENNGSDGNRDCQHSHGCVSLAVPAMESRSMDHRSA